MIHQVFELLPYLFLAMMTYLTLAVHFNLNCRDFDFDLTKLKRSVIKLILIVISFISVTFIFDQLHELSEFNNLGLNPVNLVKTLILYYVVKIIQKLKKIIENPNSILS